MRVARLQHVSTPYERGGAAELRAFYGGVLGLAEKPPPAALAARGIVWFAAGDDELELHFLPDDSVARTGSERHLCLEVDDVAAWRDRLEEAGVPVRDTTPIPNRPRFFCRDPFGNLVELTTIDGDYRGEE